MNPWGDEDEDFEVNTLIDKNLKVNSYVFQQIE